jgi:integrase/recombinase XerD
MSALRTTLDQYLALRRAFGCKLERAGRLLPDFVAFLHRHRAQAVTTELALRWAKQPPDGHPAWWAEKLSLVRGFARYLQAIDPRTEVPPADLLPRQTWRVTPYLYAEQDVPRLMHAAQGLHPPLRAATYRTFFGLLAVTGLRIGEAIRLDRQDVDWRHRLLVIRGSKFGKSREVPLHDTTVEALRAYARLRDRIGPRPKSPSFFLSTVGTRLIYMNALRTFWELLHLAGIEGRSPRCRPRPHDLRHTFAVRTLLDWYRAGVDVQARLPVLSTYLGHFDPSSTYWYLSAAPELLGLVAQRLETAHGERP